MPRHTSFPLRNRAVQSALAAVIGVGPIESALANPEKLSPVGGPDGYGWIGFAIALALAIFAAISHTQNNRLRRRIAELEPALMNAQTDCATLGGQLTERSTELEQAESQAHEFRDKLRLASNDNQKLKVDLGLLEEENRALYKESGEQTALIAELNEDLDNAAQRHNDLRERLEEHQEALKNSQALLAATQEKLQTQSESLINERQRLADIARQNEQMRAEIAEIKAPQSEQANQAEAPTPRAEPNAAATATSDAHGEPAIPRLPGINTTLGLRHFDQDMARYRAALQSLVDDFPRSADLLSRQILDASESGSDSTPGNDDPTAYIRELSEAAERIGASMLHEASKALLANLELKTDFASNLRAVDAALRHVIRSITEARFPDDSHDAINLSQGPAHATTEPKQTPLPPSTDQNRPTTARLMDSHEVTHRFNDLKLLLDEQDPVAAECVDQLINREGHDFHNELRQMQTALGVDDYATARRVLGGLAIHLNVSLGKL